MGDGVTHTAWDRVEPEGRCTSLDGHEEQRLVSGRSTVPERAFCSQCGAAYAVLTWEHTP